MSDSLRSLSDHEIHSRTQALTLQERRTTLSLLPYLNEVERREIHLKLGYSTLFDYCTTGLGHSNSAAMRRIQASRCVARFPAVYELLQTNELNLSTVCIAAKVMTNENEHEMLRRICGKSQREVEAIAAEFEPVDATPRERVRTVVMRVPSSPKPARREESGLFAAGLASDEHPANTAEEVPVERRTMIQFSADEDFMNMVARLRSTAWHRLPANASFEQVFRYALQYVLKYEDPAERHKRRKDKSTKPANRASRTPRHIPASVRDAVFVRDQGRCTFLGSQDKRCASTHGLQIDHKVPVALGGKGTVENLRLLCAKHNRFEADRAGLALPLR